MAALGLSTCLSILGGCGTTDSNSIYIGNQDVSKITYEEDGLSGTISYENLEKGYLKIVTLEYKGEVLKPKLMFTYLDEYRPMRGGWRDTFVYIDVENGVSQIEYFYPTCYGEDKEDEIKVGKDLNVVEEISLFNFIIEHNWLQEEYEINELITFFKEKVEPTLEIEESTDVSLTLKFRQNI